MSILLALHTLSAVVWVGGMFFAHVVLRPSSAVLEPAVRLPLWRRVLGRFFLWVWLAVALLLLTGFTLIHSAWGMASAPFFVHLMMGLGLLMALIFAYLYFVPWPALRNACAESDWPQAARCLARIRLLVTINLVLGLVTVVVGAGGNFQF